ncbi:PREDICTED: synaptotagmin-6 [Ceratosolen solmsi marchali]|uniref:Synaptotagmin-6 n=1 Tax=Ceratosolen solmsi marchali TaxID=326594 RepID=A0AAJ7E0K2_9HYME|nr:PREDICTED: synaptotagmin-6 [Ceratosolen solmsi marchali]
MDSETMVPLKPMAAKMIKVLKCVKVPDKLSEVFENVLELASGPPARSLKTQGSADTTTSKIGAITGVAFIRGRWTQRHKQVASMAQDSEEQQTNSEEFNVTKEQRHIQSSTTSNSGPKTAQRRSTNHVAPVMSRVLSSFSGQLSIGSQEQLSIVEQSQIRTYEPNGRQQQQQQQHQHNKVLHIAPPYPSSNSIRRLHLDFSSRSPSPIWAASSDGRNSSPLDLASSSLLSLVNSQAVANSSSGNCSRRSSIDYVRCLSPLRIPPPRTYFTSYGDGNSAPPASPLGSLQPNLYHRNSGPLFLNSTQRSGKILGQLHLRLSYDFDKSDLNIHLIEAHELARSEQGGFNYPYVKLTLSPEVDTRKRQTSIHHNDPNPYFDQHFKFPVSYEELQDKTLLLQVLDYDRFSRNDVVGSVRVAMEQLELSSSSSSIEVWGEINRERKPPEETQEILISLSYLPSAERLTLIVLKARNLFPTSGKDSLDPFVKVGLMSGEKRVKKKKTAVRKATRCPIWNEAMSFNVPAASLASSAIEICVADSSSELIGNNAIVGSCIVGPGIGVTSFPDSSAANPSKEHWIHMTHSPRKAIAMWHTLH